MPIEVLRNEIEVKNAIFETEREIANKILFTPAPKNHGKNSIKDNYPFPYYDATYFAKVAQISQLKNKVQFLKSQLEEEQAQENQLEQQGKINSGMLFSINQSLSNASLVNNVNRNFNSYNNSNYRVSNDLNDLFNSENLKNANYFNNSIFKNKIESSYQPQQKLNRINLSNKSNKNNDLHLFVIINNDTFPHKLADIENKISQNSYNFTEKNFGYEDLLKEQLRSVDSVYAKRKNQLANFNNEMKNNISDVHDKK